MGTLDREPSMSETFKAGDTVQLNSGGPRMTVTTAGDDFGTPTVWCVWFDGTKQFDGHFPMSAVRGSPDPKPTRVIV